MIKGDANLTWVAASGLTNLKHSALGSTATIKNLSVVQIHETFSGLTLDGSESVFGAAIDVTANLDGGTNKLPVWAGYNYLTVQGNRIYSYNIGVNGIADYFGTGSSDLVTGVDAGAYNEDSGSVLRLVGMGAYVAHYGSGLVTNAYGAYLQLELTSPTTNQYGIFIQDWAVGAGDVTTLVEGIHITDLVAAHSTPTIRAINYANKFIVDGTGYVQLAKQTAPSSSPANTGRLFLRDNGGGKMQLAAIFPSGAIQAIATEP